MYQRSVFRSARPFLVPGIGDPRRCTDAFLGGEQPTDMRRYNALWRWRGIAPEALICLMPIVSSRRRPFQDKEFFRSSAGGWSRENERREHHRR